MTQLNADETQEILNKQPTVYQTDLLTGSQEDYRSFKEASPFYTPITPSRLRLTENPIYSPVAVQKQQSIFDMDNAYKAYNNRSAIDNFFGYFMKQGLSEKYNRLFLEAREATGEKKEYLEDELAKTQRDLNALPVSNDMGSRVNETLASIVRSSIKTLPFTVGAAGITLLSGGTALPAVVATGATRAAGGFIAAYQPTKDALEVEQYLNNPNADKQTVEQNAQRGAILEGVTEGIGDVFGLSAVSLNRLMTNSIQRLSKQIMEKAAKKTLVKKVGEFVAEAGAEALQEVSQNNIERLAVQGKGYAGIVGGTVNNLLTTIGKLSTGEELTADEQEDIETAMSTFLASLMFGGTINATNSGISKISDLSRENKVRKADKRYFDARQSSQMPEQMQKEIISEEIKEGLMPEKRYANAQEVVDAINEQLETNEKLNQQQIDILNNIKEVALSKTKTTGVYEMSGEDYANVFLNPDMGGTLFQKANDGLFFSEPSMVKGDFSDTQLTLQAIQELLPSAIEENSAFMESYNFLKENNKGDESSIITEAVGNQVLANVMQQATGKSYADIKKENNISFTASEEIQKDSLKQEAITDEALLDILDEEDLLSFEALPKELKGFILDAFKTPIQEIEQESEKQKRKKEFKKRISNLEKHLETIEPNAKQPVFSNNKEALGLTGINDDAENNHRYTATVKINPSVFLNLSSSEFNENVDYIKEQVNEGKELATPWLEVKVVDAENKILKVTGHEGRHRSLLALLTKTETMPVILYGKDVNKYNINENINDWTLVAQDSASRKLRHEFQKDYHNYNVKIGEANNSNIQRTYYQGIAGSLYNDANQIVLNLTNASNPTTFSHETFHLFDVLMGRYLEQGQLSDYWAKQYEKMYKAVGVDITKSSVSTKAREELAESWTKYLGEGVSPKRAFDTIFAKFKAMFANMYNTMLRGGQVRPEVRKVFDRIFLSQQEAEIAAKALRVGAFKRPAGVDDSVWEKYVNAKQRTVAIASNSVVKAVTDLNKIKKTEKYVEQRKRFFDIEENVLKEENVYRVQDFVLNSKDKISASDIRKYTNGKSFLSGITSSKDNALTVDMALTMANNELGLNMDKSEFIGFLTHKTLQQDVEERVQSDMINWLQTEYADLYNKMQVYNNVANLDAVDAVLYEHIFAAGKNPKMFGEIKALMNKNVEDELNNISINELAKTDKYMKMLNANITKQLTVEEQSKEMAQLKLNQAGLMKIIIVSQQASKNLSSFRSFAEKFKGEPTKERIKIIDAKSYDLIKSILIKSGLRLGSVRENRPAIEKFADWMAEHNSREMFSVLGVSLDNGFDLITELSDLKYTSLPYTKFMDLKTLVENINKASKFDTERTINDIKYNFEMDAAEMADHLTKTGFNGADTTWNNYLYSGMMMPRLFSKIFSDDFNNKYVRPLVNGFSKAQVWKNARAEEFAAILGDEMNKLAEVLNIDLGDDNIISLSREEVLLMMLHSGNTHNSQCVIETMIQNPPKFGIKVMLQGDTEEDLAAAKREQRSIAESNYRKILESAPDNFQDITNAIWGLMQKYAEEVKQTRLDTEGFIMKLVEPSHFGFENSRLDSKLGYFPASQKFTMKLSENWSEEYINNTGYPTETYAKDRRNIHDNLDISLQAINSWIRATGDYINMAVAWNNFNRVINEQEARQALGDLTIRKIKSYLENLRRSEKTNEVLRFFDNLSNVSILGISPIKAIRQLSGLFFSSADVGVGYMINALGETFTEVLSKPLNVFKYAESLSDYMNTRYSDPSKYLYGGYDSYELNKKTLAKYFGKYSYYALLPLSYMDAFASITTWKANYAQAIAQGKPADEASFIADRAVMTTQGDSSSLARPELLRGNLRFITKYSTYFFALNSSIASDIMTIKDPKSIAHISSTIFCAVMLGSMYETLITAIGDKLTGKEDDDDELWKKPFKEAIGTMLSSAAPVAGFGGSIAKALTGEKVYRSQLTFMSYADRVAQTIGDLYSENKDVNDILEEFSTLFLPQSMVKLIKQKLGD